MADSSQAARKQSTRCRTGCRRCRIRRRKCDEQKPRCRNCTEKGFQCQYGPQLTFLNKNARTVDSQFKSPGRRTEIDGYNAILFVNSDPGRSNASSSSPTTSDSHQALFPSDDAESPIIHRNRSPGVNSEEQDNRGDETHYIDTILNNHTNNTLLWTPNVSSSNNGGPTFESRWLPQINNIQSHYDTPRTDASSDNDMSAARGLLAFATTSIPDDTNYFPHSSKPRETSSSGTSTSSNREKRTEVSDLQSEQTIHFIADWERASDTASRNLETGVDSLPALTSDLNNNKLASIKSAWSPTNRELKLLGYYRYQVAPWLDICDMRHTFGITVMQKALAVASKTQSAPETILLFSVLALAETSSILEKKAVVAGGGLFPCHITKSHSQNANIISTTDALSYCLNKVKYFISDIHGAWNETLNVKNNSELMDTLVSHALNRNLHSAMYWLMLRLDLSVALAKHTPQFILPSKPFRLCLSESIRPGDVYKSTFCYANLPILLCAKALSLSSCDAGPRIIVDAWMELVEELEQWYRMRPAEFLPMLDDEYANFPIILFTSGAGILGNQLYHTALLVLLLNKPRTIPLRNPQHMSSSWHARRICGIALHNDRRQCWDPSLLASYLYAAKQMTYEDQQQEIIKDLSRVESLTGWNTSKLCAELREEWQPLEV